MNSPEIPPVVSPAQPKKEHGCFYYGCLMALIGIGCCLLLVSLFMEACMPPSDNQLIKGFVQRRADLEKLRTMVENHQTVASEFFADEFTGKFSTSNLIAAITTDAIKFPQRKSSDIATLNLLLWGRSIHPQIQRTISLSKEVEELLEHRRDLSSEQSAGLNRLVLECAYPNQCPKRVQRKAQVEEYRRLLRSVGFGATRWLSEPDSVHFVGGGRAYFAVHPDNKTDPTPYGVAVQVSLVFGDITRSYIYLYYPPEQIIHWIPPDPRYPDSAYKHGFSYLSAPQAKDAFRQLDHLKPPPTNFPSFRASTDPDFLHIEGNWYVKKW